RQRDRLCGLERRRRRIDGNDEHSSSIVKEEFLLVGRPLRMPATRLRNLNCRSVARRATDIDLELPRLRGDVSDPAAVRRIVTAVLRRATDRRKNRLLPG